MGRERWKSKIDWDPGDQKVARDLDSDVIDIKLLEASDSFIDFQSQGKLSLPMFLNYSLPPSLYMSDCRLVPPSLLSYSLPTQPHSS